MKKIILFLSIFVLINSFSLSNEHFIFAEPLSNLNPIKLDYKFSDFNKFIKPDKLKYLYCEYNAYLDNLNYILEDFKEFKGASLEDILKNLDSLPDDASIKAKINASNALNYEYFFKSLSKEKTYLKDDLLKQINKSFSSFNNFKDEFKKIALNSNANWIFLARNPQDELYITTSIEILCPIIHKHQIILCLNINRELYSDKEKYIDTFFNFINWQNARKNYSNKIDN